MIHPKLPPYQELELRRVNVQLQSFTSQHNGCNRGSVSTAAVNSSSSSGLPRSSLGRSEASPPSSGCALGSSATSTSTPNHKSRLHTREALLTGCGTNSTAPASIARPGVRGREEWCTALKDVQPFVLPAQLLSASSPTTQRRVAVRYIADQYDRQWLAQRQVAVAVTKGKTGSIDSSTAGLASRHDISLSLFEELITAFELGSYVNAEAPVQRQPVSTFQDVIATGADSTVVEEVRGYWLTKRQALGGNVPCIPALRMDVREDNQNALCHSDVLQYCPLPFNYRDSPVPLVQRLVPRSAESEGIAVEGIDGKMEVFGRKRKRKPCDNVAKVESDREGAVSEAEESERRTLISAGLRVAQAVLEREEWKLAHTHMVLYELALLRQLSVLGSDTGPSVGLSSVTPRKGVSGNQGSGPWASDEALQEEWEVEEERTGNSYDSVTGRGAKAALESVMAIRRQHC